MKLCRNVYNIVKITPKKIEFL